MQLHLSQKKKFKHQTTKREIMKTQSNLFETQQNENAQEEKRERKIKCVLNNDHFQNFKRYGIPKAQLVIADIPYNLGKNAYGSSTEWYEGGENKNGESKKAGKSFFKTDENFNLSEYMHFCNRLSKRKR